MFNRKNKIGQNIAEYSILIALIIAAAIAMQTYVKRGLQGKVADAVNTKQTLATGGDQIVLSGDQFEPNYTTSASQVASKRVANASYSAYGAINKSGIEESTFRKADSYENTTDTAGTDYTGP